MANKQAGATDTFIIASAAVIITALGLFATFVLA